MTTAPNNSHDEQQWGGRLPLLHAHELDPEQRALRDKLRTDILPWAQRSRFQAATTDGDPIGPFNVFLHRPGPGRLYLNWSLGDLNGSSLDAPLREIIILTVGAAWHADYEIYAHTATARQAGVPDAVIAAILNGEEPGEVSTAETTVYRFTHELVNIRSISEETYQHALQTLGQEGILDMVNLIGIYLATSATLNAFQIPAPANK